MASSSQICEEKGNMVKENNLSTKIITGKEVRILDSNVLVEETEEAVVWEEDGVAEDEERVELRLVGKIWTDRHINVSAFMNTVRTIWQPKHGLDISSSGKNLFAFQFYHWKDKQRVIEGQPWHFDRHVLVLGEIEGNKKPSEMELHEFPMWVRVYNLPFKGRLNNANVEAVGNKIGSYIKMDSSGSIGIDKFVRMRIMIDARKPLLQKVKITTRGGSEEFFDVK
ncbi:uncharacterized protein LOC110704670 [Chenopodium quinoa]|uniref:uncharacterized protein LOC110704670 n=1 Tax=Chenopodium quinoa TaxID=63459 RepID=UPI000B77DFCD|nr:uncharacterized protein LOC110704670 [Chenopodium quinoa]